MDEEYQQLLAQERINRGLVTPEELDNDPELPEVEIGGNRLSAGTALDVVRTTQQATSEVEQEGRQEIKAGYFDFVKSTAKAAYTGMVRGGASVAGVGAYITDSVLAAADAVTGGKVPLRVTPSYEKNIARTEEALPELTPGEKAASGLVQFASVYAAMPLKAGVIKGALTDFTAFRQGEANLANALEQFGFDPAGITSMLSADADDGFVEGRLKNVMTGVVTDGVIKTVGLGLNLFKNARAAFDAGQIDEAKELLKQADEAMQAGFEREAPEVAAKARAAAQAPEAVNTVPLRAAADPIAADPTRVTAINTAVDAATQDPAKLARSLAEAARAVDFENPLEAAEFIKSVEAKIAPNIDSVSWQEQTEFAANLGLKPQEVKRALDAGVVSPAYIYAADAMQKQAIRYLDEVVATGDEKKFVEALSHVRETVEDMRRFSNMSGRTLNSIKAVQQRSQQEYAQMLKNIEDSTMGGSERVKELMELMKIARTPAEKFNLAKLSTAEKGWGSFLEAVNNNMLSSLKTVALQFTSIPRLAIVEPGNTFFAAINSAARNAPPGQRVYLQEVPAMMAANVKFATDSLKSLLRMRDAIDDVATVATKDGLVPAAKEGARKALRFVSKANNVTSTAELGGAGVSRKFISADTWGIGTQPGAFSKALQDMMGIPSNKQISFRRAIIDAYGAIQNAPRTINALIDVNFSQKLASIQMTYSHATRRAMDELMTGTLQKADFDARVNELITSPAFKASIKEDVAEYARRSTFSEDLGALAQKGEEMLNMVKVGKIQAPVLKLLVPFYRAGANILKQGIEQSPVADWTKGYRDAVAEGGIKLDMAAGRKMLGTSLSVAVAAPAMSGMLSGPGPTDKAAREAWMAAGYRPYSWHREVGKDANGAPVVEAMFNYKQFEPIAYPVALVAAGAEKMRWAMTDDFGGEDTQIGDYAEAVVQTFNTATFDRSVLRGISDFLELIGDTSSTQSDKLQRFMAYQAGKLVPNFARDVAGWTEPPARQGAVLETRDTVLDVALSKVPGLSQNYELKRNRWGDPVYKDKANFLGALSPFEISTPPVNSMYASEIDREIFRLGVEGIEGADGQKMTYSDAILPMPPRSLKTPAGGIKLDSRQYTRYIQLENEALVPNPETGVEMNLRDNLNYLVTQSPIYKEALPEGKAFLIKQWSQMGFGNIARDQLLREFPDLQEKYAKKLGYKIDKSVGIMGTEADQGVAKQQMIEAVKQHWSEQEGVIQ